MKVTIEMNTEETRLAIKNGTFEAILDNAIPAIEKKETSAPVIEAPIQQAPVQPIYQQPVQPVQQAPTQPAYQQPVYQQPIQQAPVPVQQLPVQPVYQQPAPVQQPLPTTQQTYSMEQLAVAATQLVDAGRRTELVGLLSSFGVQALTALPKEQYGAFATQLRAMGAKI